jgi:hypothetical protein
LPNSTPCGRLRFVRGFYVHVQELLRLACAESLFAAEREKSYKLVADGDLTAEVGGNLEGVAENEEGGGLGAGECGSVGNA